MQTIKKDTRSNKTIQKAFLSKLEETGNVSMSAKKAKVPRSTIYDWLNRDKAFKAKFDISAKLGVELLEDEAQRRAYHGTLKPIYQGGKLVGHVNEYSDTLLIFLLKGKKPEVYKDRHELTGKDGESLTSNFTINVIRSGPVPVSSEKDIDIDE